MSDVLAAIAAYKRMEVAERRARSPRREMERLAAAAAPVRAFREALMVTRGLGLIAEIKKASPSKGLIRADFDPPALALAYAEGGATCLSVLTDAPSFQGCDSYLAAARQAVTLPVLRKDFLVDPWQVAESRALNADAILVILAMVDDDLARSLLDEAARWRMDALVEVHDDAELDRACALGAAMIGINNRDLRTFVTSLAVFERLAPRAPSSALLIAESGVADREDAERLRRAGAHALLVGESLMRQPDVATATRRLLA